MLGKLVERLKNYKMLVTSLCHCFNYLDRHYTVRESLSRLNDVALMCFRDLVFEEPNGKVTGVVTSLINEEREGQQIDRALLKNVLDILTEIGMGKIDYYRYFEVVMLQDASIYYPRKASNWIQEYSFFDYILMAEECLKREKDRVAHYLHFSSEQELLEKVKQVLYTRQLLEIKLTKCHAYIGEDKIDYLSKTFSLFSKLPQGLEHIASIFEQYAVSEGMALMKQTEDVASNGQMQRLNEEVAKFENVCFGELNLGQGGPEMLFYH